MNQDEIAKLLMAAATALLTRDRRCKAGAPSAEELSTAVSAAENLLSECRRRARQIAPTPAEESAAASHESTTEKPERLVRYEIFQSECDDYREANSEHLNGWDFSFWLRFGAKQKDHLKRAETAWLKLQEFEGVFGREELFNEAAARAYLDTLRTGIFRWEDCMGLRRNFEYFERTVAEEKERIARVAAATEARAREIKERTRAVLEARKAKSRGRKKFEKSAK